MPCPWPSSYSNLLASYRCGLWCVYSRHTRSGASSRERERESEVTVVWAAVAREERSGNDQRGRAGAACLESLVRRSLLLCELCELQCQNRASARVTSLPRASRFAAIRIGSPSQYAALDRCSQGRWRGHVDSQARHHQGGQGSRDPRFAWQPHHRGSPPLAAIP